MSTRVKVVGILATVIALTSASLASAGKPSGDAIWIANPTAAASAAAAPTLGYGSSFMAGYSSRASHPWGLAQCWADATTRLATPNSGVIWSQYASLQADGTIGAFTLNDPLNNEWIGGGASCTLSLVSFQGNQLKTLATTSFTVAG